MTFLSHFCFLASFFCHITISLTRFLDIGQTSLFGHLFNIFPYWFYLSFPISYLPLSRFSLQLSFTHFHLSSPFLLFLSNFSLSFFLLFLNFPTLSIFSNHSLTFFFLFLPNVLSSLFLSTFPFFIPFHSNFFLSLSLLFPSNFYFSLSFPLNFFTKPLLF